MEEIFIIDAEEFDDVKEQMEDALDTIAEVIGDVEHSNGLLDVQHR